MDIFNVLAFIGGISLFLFGMNVMGKSLEKAAGGKLKTVVSKMTSNRFVGLLTGLGVTAIIQSSSATTVMVVGFVNSGIMNLSQAINVIMGANVGTTVTSWILSLSGIGSDNVFVNLLKPSSFAPILALIGIVLHMFFKKDSKKNLGLILLGFATLMFGMETMSSAVSGLKEAEWFKNLFVAFSDNPLLGVLTGAFVTAIIQSSSASVGILQAFATTGSISFGAAIPIILGQNIGTCVTAMISSIGTNRNAKRASLVHLFFNLIGTAVVLIGYYVVRAVWAPALLNESATLLGIALVHTAFNVVSLLLVFPFAGLLANLVCKILPGKKEDAYSEIDERLLRLPSIALGQIKEKLGEMALAAGEALFVSLDSFEGKSEYGKISSDEEKTDHYEDLIGTYLLKLSQQKLGEADSKSVGAYLKIIGDLERIGDHALNIAKIKEEADRDHIEFSSMAKDELEVCFRAIKDIWVLTSSALEEDKVELAKKVEPLEQVIDGLVKRVRDNHIDRVQKEECSIEKGFVLADLLSNVERVSDHCSNIAGYLLDMSEENLNSHANILAYRRGEDFSDLYDSYSLKYRIEGKE